MSHDLTGRYKLLKSRFVEMTRKRQTTEDNVLSDDEKEYDKKIDQIR